MCREAPHTVVEVITIQLAHLLRLNDISTSSLSTLVFRSRVRKREKYINEPLVANL